MRRSLLCIVLFSMVALVASAQGAVNLNTAGESELTRLPGIGPVLAKRILAYRSQAGTFRSVDELAKVKGIGVRRVSQLRPLVTLGGASASAKQGVAGKSVGTSSAEAGHKKPQSAAAKRMETREKPVDLNTAAVDALCALPGVGPKTAAAIIHDRQAHGPFKSVDDLARVKGIGPKKLERIRPFAAVSKVTR